MHINALIDNTIPIGIFIYIYFICIYGENQALFSPFGAQMCYLQR